MITFVSHNHADDGKPDTVLGTADVKDGKLTSSNEGVQSIIDGKVMAMQLSGKDAYDYFKTWSNGYVGSHEGK